MLSIWKVATWSLVVLTPLLFLAALTPSGISIGDGPEYYAMFFAWSECFRPWMTPPSFASYGEFVQSGGIRHLIAADTLHGAFPGLRIGEQSDFNHFWFYSFLAYIFGFGAKAPYQAFMILHAVVFSVTLGVAARLQGMSGVLAFVGITVASPIIWYFPIVHTEFVTHCAMCAAVMFVMARNPTGAALFVAAASTQNPVFAPIAVGLLAWRFCVTRDYKRWELVGSVVTVLVLALHPVYYAARYGVITPQLLAGGANIGSGLTWAYIWILDPDVGLLPRWGVGALLLAAALLFGILRRIPVNIPLLVFVLGYVTIVLFGASSTENVNSGGLPGPARYSLWLIPLFYPALVLVLTQTATVRVAAAAVLLTYAFWAFPTDFKEDKILAYTRPSAASVFVQTYLSRLYEPHPEIFMERYSGYGEWNADVVAVVGPDCHRILLRPTPSATPIIVVPAHCSDIESTVRASSEQAVASQYIFLD